MHMYVTKITYSVSFSGFYIFMHFTSTPAYYQVEKLNYEINSSKIALQTVPCVKENSEKAKMIF